MNVDTRIMEKETRRNEGWHYKWSGKVITAAVITDNHQPHS